MLSCNLVYQNNSAFLIVHQFLTDFYKHLLDALLTHVLLLQPRLVGGFNFKAAPYISMEGKCIKIYNEFVDNTQTFEKKVQTLCGKDVRECMLTPEFNIHTYTQGLVCILFSDKEKSEDCTLTLDGNITVKNTYNTAIMFKDSVITHTITEPIRVYLFYL